MAVPNQVVIFSHTVTAIEYDSLDRVAIVPIDNLAEIIQTSHATIYIKDDSDNEGAFNYLATSFESMELLLDFLEVYLSVKLFTIDSDPALTDNSDYKAPSQSAVIAYVDNGLNALTAADIGNVPAGTIAATNVQDALNELGTDIQNASSVGSDLYLFYNYG